MCIHVAVLSRSSSEDQKTSVFHYHSSLERWDNSAVGPGAFDVLLDLV